jgi:hypothetical protein
LLADTAPSAAAALATTAPTALRPAFVAPTFTVTAAFSLTLLITCTIPIATVASGRLFAALARVARSLFAGYGRRVALGRHGDGSRRWSRRLFDRR